MKAILVHEPKSVWRGFIAAMMVFVVVALSSENARGAAVNLATEVAGLQAQTDQLSKEIETLKAEVAAVEQKWKQIASVKPPSFHTDAATIQISGMATAWTVRPSASGSGSNGVAPIITFDLKNIGSAPITDINIILSLYKPDKEVVGGASIGLLDDSEGPLRTGMWKKVRIDYLQFPATRSVVALDADLYLQTDPGSYVLIGTYKISPRLEP